MDAEKEKKRNKLAIDFLKGLIESIKKNGMNDLSFGSQTKGSQVITTFTMSHDSKK